MRMPRPFVHGPKNACCTFKLCCTHPSSWQKATCYESLENSKAVVIQSIVPTQQFHLGIVDNGNGFIIQLRELFDDGGHGVIVLLGIVVVKKRKLLIDSGQSRWHWRWWIIILPLWVWYHACKGKMLIDGLMFEFLLKFLVKELKFCCVIQQIKLWCVVFGVKWNCSDELPLSKKFAIVWQVLHVYTTRMWKVIVCLLAPMMWRKQCMWEVWDPCWIMYHMWCTRPCKFQWTMLKALIANRSAMPFVNVAFLVCCTLVKSLGCMVIYTNDEGIRVEWWHNAGFDAGWHCGSKATQMLSCL